MRCVFFFIGCFVVVTNPLRAQNPIVLQSGKILYERKVNAYALMREMGERGGLPPEKVQAYQQSHPQFKADLFVLYFSPTKSYYKPLSTASGSEPSIDEWFSMVSAQNQVVTSFASGQTTTLKTVFGNSFCIADSLRHIKWRWTDELREVAGFQCRRANGLMDDSVYVVAYFTNELMSTAGPEEFHGLPGAILGLAVPALHVTWFATAVTTESYPESETAAAAAGKKVDRAGYMGAIREMTAKWGPANVPILQKAIF